MPHRYSRRHRHHSSPERKTHQSRSKLTTTMMLFIDEPFSVMNNSSSVTKTTLVFSHGRSHNAVLNTITWDIRGRHDGNGNEGSPEGFNVHKKMCSVLTFNGRITTNNVGGILRLLFEQGDDTTILTVKELANGYLGFSIPHVSDDGGVYRLQLEVPKDCRATIEPKTTFGIQTMPCEIDEGVFT